MEKRSTVVDPLDRVHAVTCMQRAGDVLYVPNGWGHAILNTRTSIGFAGEFRVVASLPPMSGHSWLGLLLWLETVYRCDPRPDS